MFYRFAGDIHVQQGTGYVYTGMDKDKFLKNMNEALCVQ